MSSRVNTARDPIKVTFAPPQQEAGRGHWLMEAPDRSLPALLDPMVRLPFSLQGTAGRLGLFQLDEHFKIATAELETSGHLHIIGSDADAVPKKCCFVTLDGQGGFRYKGRRPQLGLTQRHAVLCRPNEPEMQLEFEPGARARVAAFIFDPDIRLADDPLPRRPLEYRDGRTAILQRITAEVLDCPYVADVQRLFLQSRMLEVQAVLTQGGPEAWPSSERDARVCERAREMLLDRLDSPPGLPEIAAEVGMSASRLKVVFKRHFGKSFSEMLLEERLHRARLLLRNQEIRVEEVAWRCGYAHVSNFSRAFSRRFGLSPRHWQGTGV